MKVVPFDGVIAISWCLTCIIVIVFPTTSRPCLIENSSHFSVLTIGTLMMVSIMLFVILMLAFLCIDSSSNECTAILDPDVSFDLKFS